MADVSSPAPIANSTAATSAVPIKPQSSVATFSSPFSSIVQSPTSNTVVWGLNPQTAPGTSISQPTHSLNVTSPTGIPSTQASKNDLSGGAVAGIAIGMLLTGTVIAGAIFFFLFRRSQQKRRQTLIASHSAPSAHRPRVEKRESKMPSAVTNSVADQIPQPVSDDTITDEISKIRDSIKNHVRTYCHAGPVNQTVNDRTLGEAAQAANVSISSLVAMLDHPSTRQDALRAMFAWVILSKTADNSSRSLLPEELAKLSGSITSAGDHGSNSASYSTWKTITAALLQPRFETYSQDPSQAAKYAAIIAELDSIVAPFVQGSLDGGERRKNLTMILTRSANLAFLFFSQPGSFNFEFASSRGGLVVFPALSQTVDDNGQALNPPRILADGEIVAV